MCLAFASMIWIPVIFFYQLFTTSGTLREVSDVNSFICHVLIMDSFFYFEEIMVGRCCIFYVSDFFIIAYFGELYI